MVIFSKNILIVFFLALIVRIVNLYFLIPDDFNFISEDQDIYVNLGMSILETGKFVYNNDGIYTIETARMPLYPYFLSGIWGMVGFNPLVVIFIQSIIDSITCIIIGLISTKIVPRTFLLSGIVSAFNMNLVVSSGMILTDSLFLLFFTLFLWLTIFYLKEKRLKYLILLSLLLSISILTRPVPYYLIPILGFVFLWFLIFEKKTFNTIFLHILVFLSCSSILLIPLLDRNYSKFDVVSITSQSGLHLSRYLVPLAIHFSEGVSYEEAVNEVTDRVKLSKQSGHIDENNPFKESYYESKVSIERLFELGILKTTYSWIVGSTLNLASSGVMTMPWVRSLPHNSFYNTPGENIIQKIAVFISDADSLKYLLVVIIANAISLILFIVKLFGVYFLVNMPYRYGGKWIVFFILGVIFYFLLITGPIIGVKYMLPIEPLLTILLTIGFINIKNKWFFKR